MRKQTMPIVVLGVLLILFGSVYQPQKRLIWNRTASAPLGLYWLNDAPFTKGQWVIVSARSEDARWAATRGYVGQDWPLLKQVAGMPGDEICRVGTAISVNGEPLGNAKIHDSQGRLLPDWSGCVALTKSELFLMNSHPDSLDGRYFGTTELSDLDGTASLIWEF